MFEKSVTMTKYIFPLKRHLHILNMFVVSVRSSKLIARNLWRGLIIQTCHAAFART